MNLDQHAALFKFIIYSNFSLMIIARRISISHAQWHSFTYQKVVVYNFHKQAEKLIIFSKNVESSDCHRYSNYFSIFFSLIHLRFFFVVVYKRKEMKNKPKKANVKYRDRDSCWASVHVENVKLKLKRNNTFHTERVEETKKLRRKKSFTNTKALKLWAKQACLSRSLVYSLENVSQKYFTSYAMHLQWEIFSQRVEEFNVRESERIVLAVSSSSDESPYEYCFIALRRMLIEFYD